MSRLRPYPFSSMPFLLFAILTSILGLTTFDLFAGGWESSSSELSESDREASPNAASLSWVRKSKTMSSISTMASGSL